MYHVFINYDLIYWSLIEKDQPMSHRRLMHRIEGILNENAFPWTGHAYARFEALPYLSRQDRLDVRFERTSLQRHNVSGHASDRRIVDRQILAAIRTKRLAGPFNCVVMGISDKQERQLTATSEANGQSMQCKIIPTVGIEVAQPNWWVWNFAQEVARLRGMSTNSEFVELQPALVTSIHEKLVKHEGWKNGSVQLGVLAAALIMTRLVKGDKEHARRLIVDVTSRRDAKLEIREIAPTKFEVAVRTPEQLS